ncbi:MAG: MFS transporter, partial [Nocardioides sp.]|nr:MFS transporter [Nocardioides sp.]
LDTAPAPTAAGAPVSPGTRPGIRPDTRPGAHVGATVMVLTQVTMVAIMTMTPVHMREHGHDLADVGLVISLHIAAMYLPSPLTGRLVDRWGRTPVAVLAGAVLLASGVTAALAPGDSLVLTTLALVLLGLGWNLGLIAGTALVVDATEPATRPRVQGSIDVLVALAGATGGVLSGLVVSASSFATLSLGGGLLALALLPALRRATPRRA